MQIRITLSTFVLGCMVGCGSGDDALNITYNPCEPLSVVVAADATGEELASVDEAIAMWNRVGSFDFRDATSAAGAQDLPISFESAAPMFHGVYRDEVGDVVINRRLSDSRRRSVVIAHELGHAFGLWHTAPQAPPSLMSAGNLDSAPVDEDFLLLAELWPECAE